MDQAVSIKNLNVLLAEDRAKGGDLEQRFIPDAFAVRLKISKLKKLLLMSRRRNRIGTMPQAAYGLRISRIEIVLEKRISQHSTLLDGALERVATTISGKGFRIRISALPNTVGGKIVYGVANSLEQILAVRFVQRTLKAVYELRMPPRDILVSQVKPLALDRVPKFIIRADVESFYESVQHKELLDGIHQSAELSVAIKRILTRLLKDYLVASGQNKGVPRGIGISAYLSEIYLSSIDAQIKQQNDLFYYARYVDDMVLMYAPSRIDVLDNYLPSLKKILQHKSLTLNDKTKTIDLVRDNKGQFDYLGYQFDVSNSTRGVRLSQRKLNKYRVRLEKAFSDYDSKSKYIPRKAAEELLLRCLYLTGNARLFNRKSNAFIGIYFSNRFITDTSQLRGLDGLYRRKVSGITNSSLRRKLSNLSFENGFEKKLFRSFRPEQLAELSRGWKHV